MGNTRVRAAVAATSVLLLGTVLTACGGDSGEDGSGAPTSTVSTTGSPFDATLVGDSGAQVGATMTATLTNTGRLPDIYQVSADPADAAVIPVRDFHLSPGESVQVRIKVRSTPFDVHLRSGGGGSPDVVAFTVS
jgi:hypothetical protein